ncbi:MAG: DUF1282 family protein [Burkholderiales bacterium]|nr:DUF1282 family protein [Burkholderiales bacterium]
MSLLNYAKMPFSFHGGWDVVAGVHPSIRKTFFALILPFSLIPPLSLLYAGGNHGAIFLVHASFSRWQGVAIAFFVVELLTVPLIGWVIKNIAATHNIVADSKDTFLLAAITAVPMWLSSLALAIPHLWLMMGIVVSGLLAAASLLYHGMYTVLKMSDQIEAQSMSYEAFAVGGFVWAMLCVFVVVPLMG